MTNKTNTSATVTTTADVLETLRRLQDQVEALATPAPEPRNRRVFGRLMAQAPMYSAEGHSMEFIVLADGQLSRLKIRWSEKDDNGVVRRRETVFGNYRRYAWGCGSGWDMSGFDGWCYANGGNLGAAHLETMTPKEAVIGHFVQAVAKLQVPQNVIGDPLCQEALGDLLDDALWALEHNPRAREFAMAGTKSCGSAFRSPDQKVYAMTITDPKDERAMDAA